MNQLFHPRSTHTYIIIGFLYNGIFSLVSRADITSYCDLLITNKYAQKRVIRFMHSYLNAADLKRIVLRIKLCRSDFNAK